MSDDATIKFLKDAIAQIEQAEQRIKKLTCDAQAVEKSLPSIKPALTAVDTIVKYLRDQKADLITLLESQSQSQLEKAIQRVR